MRVADKIYVRHLNWDSPQCPSATLMRAVKRPHKWGNQPAVGRNGGEIYKSSTWYLSQLSMNSILGQWSRWWCCEKKQCSINLLSTRCGPALADSTTMPRLKWWRWWWWWRWWRWRWWWWSWWWTQGVAQCLEIARTMPCPLRQPLLSVLHSMHSKYN